VGQHVMLGQRCGVSGDLDIEDIKIRLVRKFVDVIVEMTE
jgi:hypothetical protein